MLLMLSISLFARDSVDKKDYLPTTLNPIF